MPATYDAARAVFLRAIGAVYALAFAVALEQNELLVGARGLTPGPRHLQRVRARLEASQGKKLAKHELYASLPTVLWFAPEGGFDEWLVRIESMGLALALIPALFGRANMLVMAALWILYGSVTNVGQGWYSFGWEIQLLETGFLSIFLCPFISFRASALATPRSVVWLFRWLLMRIYIGAGLIKLRGDSCWRDFTCMQFFYETTCVPNPLSWFFHTQFPAPWHTMEVVFNHVVQVCVPWTLLLSREVRMLGALAVASEMVLIQVTGNYGFLNVLTMLPAIFCFDDDFFVSVRQLWRPRGAATAARSSQQKLAMEAAAFSNNKKKNKKHQESAPPRWSVGLRGVLHAVLVGAVAVLSVPVVTNLLSPAQRMNTSYNTFSIVNTYGAFGSINRERHELVVLGSPTLEGDDWREYQFRCKPGDVSRRPCVLAPYHFRIDWALWFAGFQPYQQHPWLVHFVYKLLQGDPLASHALAEDPFAGEAPPKRIRVDKYRYFFTRSWNTSDWWTRTYEEPYLPALTADEPQVLAFLRSADLVP